MLAVKDDFQITQVSVASNAGVLALMAMFRHSLGNSLVFYRLSCPFSELHRFYFWKNLWYLWGVLWQNGVLIKYFLLILIVQCLYRFALTAKHNYFSELDPILQVTEHQCGSRNEKFETKLT